ncbi:DUF4259 domain-containing protein [Bacillus alkalicellulosilyticus]|uniref:DUF4259 domain-containing protein n=1 Tax=Alkalihalobacterium alkalicellulosilyticum TaxID=1912214 RepID=UPI001482DEE3|nr:DUF4259 domain-containing protein [Bacillus alkalicellulosilyticus]
MERRTSRKHGIGFIEETLNAGLDEELEAETASCILGAAEILSALQGSPGEEIKNKTAYVEDLEKWLHLHKGEGKELLPLAKKAVSRVKVDSELQELWEETEDYSAWLLVVTDLENRLSR